MQTAARIWMQSRIGQRHPRLYTANSPGPSMEEGGSAEKIDLPWYYNSGSDCLEVVGGGVRGPLARRVAAMRCAGACPFPAASCPKYTHSLTHTHSLSLSHTHTHTHRDVPLPRRFLSFSHIHTLSHTHCLSLPHTLTHRKRR